MDEKKIVYNLSDRKQKNVVELIYERDQDRKIVAENVSRICEREPSPNSIVKLHPKQQEHQAAGRLEKKEEDTFFGKKIVVVLVNPGSVLIGLG